jgi:hypothetical protein
MKLSLWIHGARAALLATCAAACLTRPIVGQEPALNVVFTKEVKSQTVDKVDLLFDIDNSRSMGDKQQYLVEAIPDLVNRLLNPNCVDATGAGSTPSQGGVCPSGLAPEFSPVHDMHLGIVTSSLGTRLSDQWVTGAHGTVCAPDADATSGQSGWPFANVSAHNDDRGHLVARSLTYDSTGATATEGAVGDAVVQAYVPGPSGFLAWYPRPSGGAPPSAGPTPISDPATLVADLSSMVRGAGAFGCGIESQLESWYRFLVEPDPYATLAVVDGRATWQGVDAEILRERRDFLRPDSLVAVIVLTDENDSEIDVRSYAGSAYKLMSADYPPVKGTSACARDPASSECAQCAPGSTDPACAPPAGGQVPTYSAHNDWGFDPNLRHVHMKAKYGADPQFPVQRYALGLSSATVPNSAGEYPPGHDQYDLGGGDCTNPLFAAALPDGSDTSAATLCHLPVGPRTKDLVFYAIIGGVPHELLHYVPNDPVASQLSDADWVRILGKGPAALNNPASTAPPSYDYTGIDPHMIEDYRDRSTVDYGFATDSTVTLGPRANGAASLTPSTSAAEVDPVNGREWVTDQPDPDAVPTSSGGHTSPVDLQYACVFKLREPRDCTAPQNWDGCDCPFVAGHLSHAQTSPLCDDVTPTRQLYAKAYPTPRELQVARMLGGQGIVASLCPAHPSDMGTPDAPDLLYGYRPAVATLVDRLKTALAWQCLAEPVTLTPGSDQAPCLVLVTLPAASGGSCAEPVCDESRGLSIPPQGVLDTFCKNANDPDHRSVCALKQLTPSGNPDDFVAGSCATESTDPGWCYVTTAPHCAQALVFSSSALPSGSIAYLQCID